MDFFSMLNRKLVGGAGLLCVVSFVPQVGVIIEVFFFNFLAHFDPSFVISGVWRLLYDSLHGIGEEKGENKSVN